MCETKNAVERAKEQQDGSMLVAVGERLLELYDQNCAPIDLPAEERRNVLLGRLLMEIGEHALYENCVCVDIRALATAVARAETYLLDNKS